MQEQKSDDKIMGAFPSLLASPLLIYRSCLPEQPFKCCSQFLVHEDNVRALQPTNVSILTYNIPVQQQGPMDPKALKLKGHQATQHFVPNIMQLFASSCEGIFSNTTLVAALKVHISSQHKTLRQC